MLTSGATPAAVGAPSGDPGRLQRFSYETSQGVNQYLVYTPSTYSRARPGPLVVVLHGCNTTAWEQAKASRFHPVAERGRFVVVYPDTPVTTQCWKWFDPESQRRAAGDPAVIAGMTRRVTKLWNIDRQRVYVIGASSGGMMTSILGATYPDVYAAIGLMAGCAYKAVACLLQDAYNRVEPVDQEARWAYEAMGRRARIVPLIELHGDEDHTVPPGSGKNALRQWLMTDDIVAGRGISGKWIPGKRSATRWGTKPGGYRWTVHSYSDRDGCLVAEHWTIHGMRHKWSGGSADPRWDNWTDHRGPSTAEAAWRFFSRYRLSDTSLPCTETFGSRRSTS